jgi:hypothetical protein
MRPILALPARSAALSRRLVAWACCALALAPVAPAGAQEPPACTPAREGLELCIAEKLCRCHFEPGGSLTGRPPGLRWDCGILRPSCGVVPAGPPQQAPPWLFSRPPAWPRPGG